MASISRRPNGRWMARYREFPGGPQKSKTFDRKVDATRWLTDVEHRLLSGSYIAPEAGQVTVASYAVEWTARRQWRPATAERIERELRLHILPALGARPLGSLRRSHIEEWAAGLPLAPSSAETVAQSLSAMLASAVDDELMVKNPAVGARMPRADRAPVVPMTAEEVMAFAHGLPDHLRAAAVLAAGTGLRQGEVFGLTTDRVQFLRRELRVDRQLSTPSSGPAVLAAPKSSNSFRTVALSGLVLDALSAHVNTFGTGVEDLFFHHAGRPIVRAQAAKHARRAAEQAGIGRRTWHDIRHHHASVLLSAGVSPALVAERLGHDVATLLRTYAHVIRADDDRVRGIVDDTLGRSAEDWLRTGAG
ncbi:MAG: tyrosine-type recombinase/integrase [Acidimicrobiales bacterium]